MAQGLKETPNVFAADFTDFTDYRRRTEYDERSCHGFHGFTRITGDKLNR